MSDFPYRDLGHPGNGERHRTGKLCIEPDCDKPAGTAWSPLWCPQCNIKRMDRIDAAMRRILRSLEERSHQ